MAVHITQNLTLEQLIAQQVSAEEWPDTANLIKEFRAVKKRGWLTREDLVKVCYWKSPRAIHYINANTPAFIKKITAEALGSRNEAHIISTLIQLKGVSIPMASALLTLVNPKRYGVMDIRVWQLLYQLKEVHTNPGASGFSINEWLQLLQILRNYAKKFKVSARDVERTLFLVHKQYQQGVLYG